jgi:hypothetical protein
MKLNQRTVDTIALPEGKRDMIVFDKTLPGFGLRIREGGSRIFVVQYKIGGLQRRMTLGSTALIRAEQARARAVEMLAKVKLGGDPAGDKALAQAQAGETFAVAVRRHLNRQKARLRPSSYATEERYLLGHFAGLHPLALTRIDRRAVAAQLTAIATDRGPGAADRARAALSAFFTWAHAGGTGRRQSGQRHQHQPHNTKPRSRAQRSPWWRATPLPAAAPMALSSSC